ncbi:uncharacterized protein N7496_000275 [Penicillium cataractarum]|uniref:Uncharacterized protein n=1 Tax=Penicillium cataractarum TaxID=2100454 RepID=A0A9W9VTQ3_9EURO|nr:uncharacterized protein N7496_000275 [Penicillium cataractarum]KAJ5389207.1 hypothetical protein N7496_000275 [Penicillium cataractarum]
MAIHFESGFYDPSLWSSRANDPRLSRSQIPALRSAPRERIGPRRLGAIDWKRDYRQIEDTVRHWFAVIGRQLADPSILLENVYNMNETGVLLSVLKSLKVLVHRDDLRKYRGTTVKRTLVIFVDYSRYSRMPCDISVFGPLKTVYRASINTTGKPHFTYLHNRARNEYALLRSEVEKDNQNLDSVYKSRLETLRRVAERFFP